MFRSRARSARILPLINLACKIHDALETVKPSAESQEVDSHVLEDTQPR